MDDYLRKKGIRRDKKINILLIIILALTVRLFFSNYFLENVLAEKLPEKNKIQKISHFDPLKNINIENLVSNSKNKPETICHKTDVYFKNEKSEKEKEYEKMLKGYPILSMNFEIAKKDKAVAAFLIAIAKKESDWGRRSPKKNGIDCYNYWGYRGKENPTDSGYSCFDSPKQAVSIVGGRIEKLLEQKINTPEKMVVWKCGRDCSWDNPENVKKWIRDVSFYYEKLNS